VTREEKRVYMRAWKKTPAGRAAVERDREKNRAYTRAWKLKNSERLVLYRKTEAASGATARRQTRFIARRGVSYMREAMRAWRSVGHNYVRSRFFSKMKGVPIILLEAKTAQLKLAQLIKEQRT
jgi:hypothetical protein